MEAYLKADLQNSIYDGVFANMFATLTGGVFLTGFALHLGMNEFMIGLGAALGTVMARVLLKLIVQLDFRLFSLNLVPLHVIFIISTFLRLLSFQMLRYVSEPEEAPVSQIVRVLRSIRGLNMATGFNYLLHPFIEIWENKQKS